MQEREQTRWLVPADWPIVVKIALMAVSMVVLALGVTTAINAFTFRAELSETIGLEFENLATAQMGHLTDILSEQLTMLRSIAMAKVARTAVEIGNNRYDGDPAAIEALLLDLDRQWQEASDSDPLVRDIIAPHVNFATPLLLGYMEAFPDHLEILIADRHGALVSATGRISNYYQADEEWWQVAFNDGRGGFYIGQPAYDESAGQEALDLAVPVFSELEKGEVIGVIRTTYRVDAIYEEMSRVQLGQTGRLSLVDADGRIIADSQLEAVGQELPSSWMEAEGAEGTAHHDEWASQEDVPLLVGHASISDVAIDDATEAEALHALGWVLYAQQAQKEAYAPVASATRTALISVGLFALVAAGLASVMTRTMMAPLGDLTNAAQEMAAGNLEVRAPVQRRDETGVLARAFNDMVARIAELVGSLEEQVAERTEALQRRTTELEGLSRNLERAAEESRRRALRLEASSQVAQAVTSVLDRDELLKSVVDLIADQLDFYHVGVFIVDETGQYTVLRAANSEGGQRMLARGHRLRVGEQGAVGYVTGAGEPRIALDVGGDAVFFDNPDLPETRSEVALPLTARGQILGALDIQSREPEAFAQEDVAVFQTLADQIAVALDNARLFEESQQALQALRRIQSEYVAQEWESFLETRPSGVATYHRDGAASPAENKPIEVDDGKAGHPSASLTVPIKLHGQTIGVLGFQEAEAERSWTEDEMALVETVADQMAQALESARLLEQTQARAHREAVARQITERIRDAMDVDAMLQTAIRELGQALGASEVYVQLEADAAGNETGVETASAHTDGPKVALKGK